MIGALILGIILGLGTAGFLVIRHSFRIEVRDSRLIRLRKLLLIIGILVGIALSLVPWPIPHRVAGKTSMLSFRYLGIPAPVAYSMRADPPDRPPIQVFHGLFGPLALPINACFWAGLFQIVPLLGMKRRIKNPHPH